MALSRSRIAALAAIGIIMTSSHNVYSESSASGETPFERAYPIVEDDAPRAVPPLASGATALEAEDGDFFGVKEEAELQGYSGSGYVRFPAYAASSSTLVSTFSVAKDGYYCLRLVAAVVPGADSLAQARVDVDGDFVAAQRLPIKGAFVETLVNRATYLARGEHRLEIASLRGEWALDRIYVEEASAALYAATLPRRNLVTPDPLPSAQALYEYLLDMQGKGMLSGQQIYSGTAEIKAIAEVTGKYPAVLGVDFIDASPSRVERGTRSFSATEAIKYWKQGGIVAACWHWNAPVGLIDKGPDKYWYSGFYAKATTFDFAAALDNPESPEYALMLRDIDAIAAELKKVEAAGVPLLWRPLHEASGGWFWWGSKGPEAYLKLYDLVFDRLTRVHGLRNLIWVWNGQDPAWYPGDDKADIVSIDIYPNRRDYKDQLDALAATAACALEPKLVAMSENGTLPDVDAIAEKRLPWSWFCTWNGEFAIDKAQKYSGEYTDSGALKRFYDNPYLVSRGGLPALGRK
jgi:Beta-mannanase